MRPAAAAGAAAVAGLVATSWTALTLAEFGRFGPALPLLAFPAAFAAVLLLLPRAAESARREAFVPHDLVAAVIACSTLVLTLPADEILLGGQDPSVYVHTAAAVARQGSLLLEEPDIAALAKGERRLLLNPAFGVPQPFTGMWLLRDGRISPQFFHLYPGLMAVAWSFGGVRAALLVNPLLNVAAVLALYALAALLLGRRWALAAALLHACWAAQVRQAKFPTAELLAQFFLLAGAALLLRALREERPPPLLAPLAGAALGMALLARYDTLLFLVPFAALLLWGMEGAGRTRTVLAALATTGMLGAQAWLHQRLITPVYHPGSRLLGPVLVVVAGSLAAGLLLRRTAAWRRFSGRVPWRGTALRAIAVTGLCAWVLFAWFLRPGLEEGGVAGSIFALLAGPPPYAGIARLLVGAESRNMLMLAGVLGSAGAAAAVAGTAALLMRRGLFETAWLGASAAVLALLVAILFHDHYLMWASRRFVPVVLPLASVAIAGAGALLASARRGPPRLLAAGGAALVAAILALNAADTAAMARTREWPGLIAWFETLERALPADAEVYCRQLGFAAPLRFVFGRRAYEFQQLRRFPEEESEQRSRQLFQLLRRRAAAGKPVFYLSEEPEDELPRGFTPVGSHPLRSSTLSHGRFAVPTTTRLREVDLVLYRVEPRPPDPALHGNGLPESVGSVMVRSGKTATSPRGGALEVRRTSEARSTAAGARQGLPSDPG